MPTILYVLLAIATFGVLIVIHELGHFLVARAFGVGIREFSIGMGPKLFSVRGRKSMPREALDAAESTRVQPLSFEHIEAGRAAPAEEPWDGTTVYSIRALPIGGYVSMIGEDEENDDPASFNKKKVWQRILVVVAGAAMNILLGFILSLILTLSATQLASTTVGELEEGASSAAYGLAVGDTVTHVAGVRVHTGNELVYEIMNSGYEPITLTVIRDGREVTLENVIFPVTVTEGVAFGQADFRVFAEEKTFGSVMKHSFFRGVSTVKMIFDQLGDLLTGRFGLNAMSGPVGVTDTMVTVAKTDMSTYLYLVLIITVNLGVFNLLPIPALDGGRLLFLLIEAVTRRPVKREVEGMIHFIGMALLLLLMFIITFKDITKLFIR